MKLKLKLKRGGGGGGEKPPVSVHTDTSRETPSVQRNPQCSCIQTRGEKPPSVQRNPQCSCVQTRGKKPPSVGAYRHVLFGGGGGSGSGSGGGTAGSRVVMTYDATTGGLTVDTRPPRRTIHGTPSTPPFSLASATIPLFFGGFCCQEPPQDDLVFAHTQKPPD